MTKKQVYFAFVQARLTPEAHAYGLDNLMRVALDHSRRVQHHLATLYDDAPDGTAFAFLTGDDAVEVVQVNLLNGENQLYIFGANEFLDGGILATLSILIPYPNRVLDIASPRLNTYAPIIRKVLNNDTDNLIEMDASE